MKTIKEFCEKSHLPAKLIRAVVKQSGGWEQFKESAEDMSYSIDGGFHGFIYYVDTVPFAQRNKAEILEVCEELAQDIGEGDAIQLIAGFNCLKMPVSEVAEGLYKPRSNNKTQVFNALAWFAGEEVARNYVDLCEE